MANSRVEIISGQLAGTVLENAASEATLRDLVNSINKMNTANSRAGGAAGSPSAAIGGLSAASSTLSKSFDSVGKSLNRFSKGAVGAMAGLTATLLKGSEKLSDYTKVLNDELIANIPIVGGALSGLGNVITSSIQTFESWNDSLKQATQFGASFNNNILMMRQAAGEAYLGLDDFVAILRENREGLIGLGGTATRGAKAFSKVASELMKPGGLGTTLVDMGYSVEAVQGGLAKFLTTTMKGTRFEMMNSAKLAELSGKYLINLDKITKLTGKSAEQQANDMQIAAQDNMYRLEMLKLLPKERAKMEAGLAEFTARFGPAGAELFKQVALGMPPLTTNTRLLTATMPGAVDAVIKLQRSAKNTSIGMDKYSAMSNETMADAVMSAVRSYGSLENIFKAAASGADGTAAQLYEAYGPILTQIANLGGGTEITREKLLALAKQAQKEQKDRETITQTLNRFGLATRQVRNELQLVFLEAIKSLTTAFGDPNGKGGLSGGVTNLSIMFKEFSEKTLKPLARDLGPALKKFIGYLSTDEGRDLIVENIKLLFASAMLELKYSIGKDSWLARQLGIGISEEEYLQRRDELEGRRVGASLDLRGPAEKNYLATVAQIESGGNPRAAAETSTARGLYQFLEGTVGDINKRYGTSYTLEDRFNPKKATEMMQLFTSGNKQRLTKLLGRAPSNEELYMAHMLGADGANKFLRADRSANVSSVVGSEAFEKNKKFFTTGGREKTVQETIDTYLRKYQQRNLEVTRGQTTDTIKQLLGPGFATGTLGAGGVLGNPGSPGKYFADFGSGRFTQLHGLEAVLTPKQLIDTVEKVSDTTAKSFIGAGSQNGMGEMISSLNSNMSTLIGLTKQQLDISRSQLSVQKKLNPDMFMVS